MNKIIKTVKETITTGYSGKYYPKGHQLGMKVPAGGSSCAKCMFLTNKTECRNKFFQAWRKDSGAEKPEALPAPANEYCCDLFETF
jgi:hypothetical protein